MRALFHNRDFMLFWFASVIASISGVTLEFVISLYVFDLTGSAALFGLILSIVIIPRMILYPIVGVISDRHNRKLLFVLSTIFILVVLCFFSSWHFIFVPLGIPHLFALVIALEMFNCIFYTLSAVIPPMIVSDEQLGAANSFGIIYSESGYLIGVLLASLVYAALGFGFSLLGVTACFLLCLVFVSLLRLPRLDVDVSQPARSFVGDMREGVKIVAEDSLVIRLLAFAPVFNFFFFPLWELVFIFFLRGELGLDVGQYGLFMSLQSVTNVLTALLMGRFYSDRRAIRLLRLSPVLLLGSMAFLFAAAFAAHHTPLWVVVALSFVGSNGGAVVASFFVIGKNTLVQKRVTGKKLSRVFSINRLTGLVAMPVGIFLYGFIVEGLGVIAALVFTTLGILSLFFIVLPLQTTMLNKEEESILEP